MTEVDQRLAALQRVKDDIFAAIASSQAGAADQELARKEVTLHALAAESHLRSLYEQGFWISEPLEADAALLERNGTGGIEGYHYLFKHFTYHLDWMKKVPQQLRSSQFTPDLARLSQRKGS